MATELGIPLLSLRNLRCAKEESRQTLRIRRRQLAAVIRQQRVSQQRSDIESRGAEVLDYQIFDSTPTSAADQGGFPTVGDIEGYWAGILSEESEHDPGSEPLASWERDVQAERKWRTSPKLGRMNVCVEGCPTQPKLLEGPWDRGIDGKTSLPPMGD